MGSFEVAVELDIFGISTLPSLFVGNEDAVSSSLNRLGEEERVGDRGDEGVELAEEEGRRCGTEMAVLRCNQT